jgi:hypothetical protein
MWLSEADSRESIAYYLNRNPDLSFVCVDEQPRQAEIIRHNQVLPYGN